MRLDHWFKWKLDPPLIVLISGKARHGKDTFGKELMTRLRKAGLDVQRISFGDEVKKAGERKDRDYLQVLGSVARKFVDKDIWIHRAIDNYDGADVVVITDARYPNEISFFENKPSVSVRVNRVDSEGEIWESNLTEEQKNHPSETALDNFLFDYTFNAETVEDLKTDAEFMTMRCLDIMEKEGGLFWINKY